MIEKIRWKIVVISIPFYNDQEMQDYLNKKGDMGLETVSVCQHKENTNMFRMVFKCPITEVSTHALPETQRLKEDTNPQFIGRSRQIQ